MTPVRRVPSDRRICRDVVGFVSSTSSGVDELLCAVPADAGWAAAAWAKAPPVPTQSMAPRITSSIGYAGRVVNRL